MRNTIPSKKRPLETRSATPKTPENGQKQFKRLVRGPRKMNKVNDSKLIREKSLDVEDVDPLKNRLSIPLNRLPSPPRNFPKRRRTVYSYQRPSPLRDTQDPPKSPDIGQNPPQDPPQSPGNGQKPSKWLLQVLKKMNIVNDPKLVIEKSLDLEDVDPLKNRLVIPLKDIIHTDFLVCCESKILTESEINKDGKMGVAAILVDQTTKNWQVILKGWTNSETKESFLFLTGEWRHIVEGNGLRDDDNITLWSFRSCAGILHFALDFAGDSVELTP